MKKLIFLAIIYCFLFTVLCLPSFSAILLDRVVATINGEVITWSELRKRIELENKNLLKDLTGKAREKKINEIEAPFLNNIIDLKLQLQAARRLGFGVGLAETDAAVAEIMKKYNLTDESLAESLKVEGFDMEEYKNQLAEQILLTKVVRYEVKTSIVIGDKQIREYYEVNKEKYRKEEKVRIRLIFFAGDAKDNLQKTDIEAKAEEVMQMIEAGEDFAKIASGFSEDASKEVGGDLGYVSRGSVLEEIEDVVFDMKSGEVSKPFWSSVGFHIVKLEDRREGSEVEEIRDEIKGILIEEAFKLKLEEWVKKLREEAYIEIKL